MRNETKNQIKGCHREGGGIIPIGATEGVCVEGSLLQPVFEPTPTLTGHMVCVMPAVSFACVLTTPQIHQ